MVTPTRCEPALLRGSVMHARHTPVTHRFRYPSIQLRLPLSQLAHCGNCLLGIERAAVFSVRNRDHGALDGSALLPWIRALLERAGLATVADGEVVLQTLPRLFGFVFNPVSFWFCHDRAGGLRAVLAEVNNTFGESHRYLLRHDDQRVIADGDELCAAKAFHVSPFFPVRGEYRFRFHVRHGVYAAAIDLWDGGQLQLSTRVAGRAHPLDAFGMARVLAGFPFLTLGIVARIHWQALQLWLKRVPFHRKPAPAIEEILP